jgi:bifunctional non-homologous end joining protein LigD
MATKRKAGGKSRATAANAVERQLTRYREMRDFKVTSEPSGEAGVAKTAGGRSSSQRRQLPFVIQKHAASHLHYDFRLGWNGVLKSWAVAKGPSYFPGDKRLAIQVEDHPIEYGGFEGIITKRQYGGGTVMLWDQGTWEPQAGHTDVDEGFRRGSLKFTLHGTKMKGNWTLVRMGRNTANERKPKWLLIKEHDGFERTSNDPGVTEAKPNSVVTGRDLEQIARSEDHVWDSRQTSKGRAWHRNDAFAVAERKPATTIGAKVQKSIRSKPGASLKSTAALLNAPKEKIPDFVAPELALSAKRAPSGAEWLHELKLDGYRIQAHKNGRGVKLLTRTGLDWTHRMKPIADAVNTVPARTAILDGEVVVLAESRTTSFADLQAAFQEGAENNLTYFVFDLLHLDGHNLRGLPLVDRKAVLAELVEDKGDILRFSEHIATDGEAVFHKACELHAEGIVSKRATSQYRSGRSGDWLKLKCVHEQEFIIGGFSTPSNGSRGVGALLLGYYADGKLVYAGRTGTGFTQKIHQVLRDKLEKLRQPGAPFDKPPSGGGRGAIWVKPELVAQVSFATWTSDGLVRQAAFRGLREDKPAGEVRREEQAIAPKHRTEMRTSRTRHRSVAATASHAHHSTKSGFEHAPVHLTHPEKLLDAESRLTKQQLADYYWAIAPSMLRYVANRPLSLVRCPDGTGRPCFYQKHTNHTLPPGVESVDISDKKTGKSQPYITLSTPEALAGLAQLGVLEVHPWGSTISDIEHPDQVVFDLDPGADISWRKLADGASDVRKHLSRVGLKSFLKTTGGKGLHVVVPLNAKHDWATVKQFAHTFALSMEKRRPELYLSEMSKAARKGRIFIDYLRNQRGATAIAPYSPRARDGATVALPLSWSDLERLERPIFRVAQFDEWKRRLTRDPWKHFLETRQVLGPTLLKAAKRGEIK